MATEDYNIGWADATGNGWNPVDRRGPELEHYSKGFVDGCNRAKPHQLMPLDNFTVTRPEPTRAEMAMHMPVPDELSVWAATAIMGEAPPQWSSKEDIKVNQKCVAWWLECEARYRVMQADALRAALDRKEASR